MVDVRPPKRMKKRRDLDALANMKKHCNASTATARPTDRRALVAPDDSSSSDVYISAERGACQPVTRFVLILCQMLFLMRIAVLVLQSLHTHAGYYLQHGHLYTTFTSVQVLDSINMYDINCIILYNFASKIQPNTLTSEEI